MFSLWRYKGEKILMKLPDGSEIRVMVGKRKGNYVQLLTEAPECVLIGRPGKEQDLADREAYRLHRLGKAEDDHGQ